jgi:hypothetical protein
MEGKEGNRPGSVGRTNWMLLDIHGQAFTSAIVALVSLSFRVSVVVAQALVICPSSISFSIS